VQEEVTGREAARWRESVESLLADLQRYRELYENAPDGHLVTDLQGTIEEVNWAAAQLLRTDRAFLVGKPLPFLIVPEERRSFYGYLARVRHPQNGAYQEGEFRLQPRKAPPVDALLAVTPVVDAEGRPVGLRWLIRDITTRKTAEADLRTEKEFVNAVLDTAQALVLVLDPDGRMTRLNAYVEAVSGYRREELLGQDMFLLIPEAERPAARAAFQRALEGVLSLRTIHPLRTRSGDLRTVAWRGKPLTSPGGNVSALIVVGDDITDLQEAQRQALQYERLAAIGQTAAGLAHESRNALQRSQACLERLRWKLQGQPGALDLVDRLKKAQDDLARLYEDVREYAGPIKPEYRRCDLAEVWREAWAQLTALAPKRDARLEEEPGGTATVCAADPFRLGQVFRNLLENALTACPDPVRVRIACRNTTLAGRPALQVVVRDNGPGFGADERRHLFEPFYTTKVKGTGLGLAIVKRIVEAHGGEAAAGGAPGQGAEIVITLPRSQR
jgi:PAS domain S-box-containing protein